MLYAFVGGQNDGALAASVIQGSDGNFYGTTQYGGPGNAGTVFKVTPTGTESVLHSFAGGSDGALPQLPLTQGSDGNLYGTTPYGGKNGDGVVFRVTPAGVETVLLRVRRHAAVMAPILSPPWCRGATATFTARPAPAATAPAPAAAGASSGHHGGRGVDALSLRSERQHRRPAPGPFRPDPGNRREFLRHHQRRRPVRLRHAVQAHPGRCRDGALLLRRDYLAASGGLRSRRAAAAVGSAPRGRCGAR